MYQIQKNESFYLCKYNFDLQHWEKIRCFENERNLIKYIGSRFYYIYQTHDECGDVLSISRRLENDLQDTANYTGRDTISCDGIRYFRDIMIVDANDRIIDWREYKEKALYEYYNPEPKRYNNRWWRHVPPYEYRYDPVGFTGNCRYKGRYGRTLVSTQ